MNFRLFLIILCLIGFFGCGAQAANPPAWIQPGTVIMYKMVSSGISGAPPQGFVNYTIFNTDGYSYEGISELVDVGRNPVSASYWSYDPGLAMMGRYGLITDGGFWVDADDYAIQRDQNGTGRFEAGGEFWNVAKVSYGDRGSSGGTSVDLLYDLNSGLVLQWIFYNTDKSQYVLYEFIGIGQEELTD
ncbi:MAG TPA: hypothetical protein VN372_01595 [Methanospirillum sp.]|nr:hypothetical protein [Methanospirillum sp.]